MSDNNELVVSKAPAGQLRDTQLAVELGNTFAVPAQSIINLLRDQIIQVPRGEQPATPAELAVVMSVMRQYRLNPMLKQVHAWRDWQGRMAIMVGYDGWVQYAREQPSYKGISYEFGPVIDSPDGKGKKCWEWIRATVHDRDRGDLQMVPVYLEEWYVKPRKDKPEPWQNQTKHRLHLKAFTSAIREVYGLGGVSDEVDRDVLEAQRPEPEYHTAVKVETMAAALPELDAAAQMARELNTRPRSEIYAEAVLSSAERHDELVDAVQSDLDAQPETAADDYEKSVPIIDAPCGFKGCSGMAVARCGECGEWVCAEHLGANGFSCVKHEGAPNG